jgi:DeoR family transcriptional regulator, aga operon transcriptional repressor
VEILLKSDEEMMLERRKAIIQMLKTNGFVTGVDLAQEFGVNIATIRRDLKSLAEELDIELCYGGARLIEPSFVLEQKMDEKMAQNIEAKRIIAQKAAALIRNGDSIALNAGSTVEYILDYLHDVSDLTVLTIGLNIAVKASTYPFINLIMPGGVLRHSSQVFEGSHAEHFLRQISIDKVFLGAVAVDTEMGWSHPILTEVELNRILMKNARKKYLVADLSKFDKVSLSKVEDLSKFDAIITDGPLPPHYQEYAKEHEIELI